jgi:hypothetical protein
VSAPTAFIFACQMICLLPHEVRTPTSYKILLGTAMCKSTVSSRLLVVITVIMLPFVLGLIIIVFAWTGDYRCIMYHWWALRHVVCTEDFELHLFSSSLLSILRLFIHCLYC